MAIIITTMLMVASTHHPAHQVRARPADQQVGHEQLFHTACRCDARRRRGSRRTAPPPPSPPPPRAPLLPPPWRSRSPCRSRCGGRHGGVESGGDEYGGMAHDDRHHHQRHHHHLERAAPRLPGALAPHGCEWCATHPVPAWVAGLDPLELSAAIICTMWRCHFKVLVPSSVCSVSSVAAATNVGGERGGGGCGSGGASNRRAHHAALSAVPAGPRSRGAPVRTTV